MARLRCASAALVPLFAVAGGCRETPKPAPAPQRAALPLVTRLGPALAAPTFWLMEGEQKPSVLLGPAESRELAVAIPDGSRLRFSLATLKGAPPRGELVLEVLGDGRPLEAVRIPSGRSKQWRSASVDLGRPAPRSLGLRLSRTDARAQVVPRERDADAPRWVALGAPRLVAPVAPAERKVLVWISVDTLRADHLGTYGYSRATSPTIDRFARDAVVFENAVSTASWTLPSLTSQFTSRYPSEHGGRLERFKRDARKLSVWEALGASGFSVLGVTANHFVSPKFGTAEGFDTLWNTQGDAVEVTRLALQALDQWDGGHLALFIHYMDPHAYYDPPSPFDALFESAYRGPINGRNFESSPTGDPAALRRVKGLYDGEIAFTDQAIGTLLEGLAARGLLQRSVVAFTADHGEEFLDHGGWTHSRTVYQEMLHVPLVLRLPGIAPRRVADVVSMIDLAPTLLDALGLPAPDTFGGRSLLPLARGATLPERVSLAETERTLDATLRLALRRGGLKYILTTSREALASPPVLREELYDLDTDPEEAHPIPSAPDLAGLRSELVAYLVKARAQAGVPVASELSAEDRERLRALGYLQ